MATIFISHTFSDELQVRKIKSTLEKAGHTIWIAQDQIKVGESIPDAVSRGLHRSNYVVVCLSKAALASSWVRNELESSVMRQFRDRTERVLPVRLEDVELPEIIGHLLFIDLFPERRKWRSGVQKLEEDIRSYEIRNGFRSGSGMQGTKPSFRRRFIVLTALFGALIVLVLFSNQISKIIDSTKVSNGDRISDQERVDVRKSESLGDGKPRIGTSSDYGIRESGSRNIHISAGSRGAKPRNGTDRSIVYPLVRLTMAGTARTGFFVDEKISRQPLLRWKYAYGSSSATAPIVSSSGVVVFGASSGFYYGLDANNGAVKWKFLTSYGSPPVILGDFVYFVSGNHLGYYLYAVKVDTGRLEWKVELPVTSYMSPLIADGLLFISGEDGTFKAFSIEQKRLVWETAFVKKPTNAAFADSTLYLGVGKQLLAIESASGVVRWRHNCIAQVNGPSVRGGLIYLTCGEYESQQGTVTALYAIDGKEVWRLQTGKIETGPSVDLNSVYYVSGNGLTALDSSTGKMRWHFETAGTTFSKPVIAEDVVYFGASSQDENFHYYDHTIYGVDVNSGTSIWTYSSKPHYGANQPFFIDRGTLYVSNETGNILAFK